MTDRINFLTVLLSTGVSALAAIISVLVTYMLAKKREHEADWRKLKLGQYQEFVLALSGVVRERATPVGQRRYADAVNSMALIAPYQVLVALQKFQNEITYMNNNRSDERHDHFLGILLREMRKDVHPGRAKVHSDFSFRLLGLPAEMNQSE